MSEAEKREVLLALVIRCSSELIKDHIITEGAYCTLSRRYNASCNLLDSYAKEGLLPFTSSDLT